MSLFPRIPDGYYDEAGQWQRTKFCFVYCGPERCTCGPPNRARYSEAHDKRQQKNAEQDSAPAADCTPPKGQE